MEKKSLENCRSVDYMSAVLLQEQIMDLYKSHSRNVFSAFLKLDQRLKNTTRNKAFKYFDHLSVERFLEDYVRRFKLVRPVLSRFFPSPALDQCETMIRMGFLRPSDVVCFLLFITGSCAQYRELFNNTKYYLL